MISLFFFEKLSQHIYLYFSFHWIFKHVCLRYHDAKSHSSAVCELIKRPYMLGATVRIMYYALKNDSRMDVNATLKMRFELLAAAALKLSLVGGLNEDKPHTSVPS